MMTLPQPAKFGTCASQNMMILYNDWLKKKNNISRYIVTGGIASGKSTVVSQLEANGVGVVDADKISRKVFSEYEGTIRQMFNTELEGVPLRQHVGKIVFKDKDEREKLEKLLFPFIFDEMNKQSKLFEYKPFIYDLPTYFEKKLQLDTDFVILVYVSRDIQLERLMKRNGLTEEEAFDRINAQLPAEEKLHRADFVIDNSGNVDDLDTYVKILLKTIFNIG